MKKIVLLLFGAACLLQGQSVVKNGPDPLHENPGRVIRPKPVMRIAGEGEGYYFNSASSLQLDSSGNIYINDTWPSNREGHLLKFDGEGRFLADLYRRGEGPGEIRSYFDFFLSEDRLYAYDYERMKVVVMDLEGEFIQEFKTGQSSMDFYGIKKGNLVFMRIDYPFDRKTSRLYDVGHCVVLLSPAGEGSTELTCLANQTFYCALGLGGGAKSWDPFHSVMGNGKLFINRTREYKIEVLDLDTGRILSVFSRKYRRVRHENFPREREFDKKYNAPKLKYETDIRNLYFDSERLYVETSTRKERKGSLWDIFDDKGRFLDSFYLDIDKYVITFLDGFLYYGGSDEEGFPYVVKARLE